ncbi:biotin-[acetyl-CoA-carboxylase] ligase [Nematocida ausubeli]|uniref:Biotin-[acetyl-CoA-carboxylase] ligase n=1 Tax=Nematocida ausubeli (strain ATCC PRA-371 / ERTm2) TaxID=1913371 RepID=A0A086J3E3_NEMA1|nr:biotin-[acetyl-CoA-carboxylase] ligase [Nematocida ausubeli]KFG26661.1 biotin-[acetyl-CoA-carboxylase] ligase [Nematocida ausubeli]
MHIVEEKVLASTQDYCMENHATLPVPTAVIAEMQTRGKGREGTNWVSSNGSLTFSILINVENHFENVSIIVSNIIKNILQKEYQIDSIRVKWPNDIFLVQGQDEYKVGGVLVNYLESVSQKQASATAVIGVGINLQQCPQKSIQYKTIYEMIERPISKKELFLKLVHEIERVFSSKETYTGYCSWSDYFPYNYVIYKNTSCNILRIEDALYIEYDSKPTKLSANEYSYSRKTNTIERK